MSLAWTTVLVLVLLQPGIVFSAGLYSSARSARNFDHRNPFGELALALLAAAIIHLATLLVLGFFSIDVPLFVLSVLVDYDHPAEQLVDLEQNLNWGFAYFISTSVAGFVAGRTFGRITRHKAFRWLTTHKWTLNLLATDRRADVFPLAYVMTKIQHEERVLMYQGFVEEFYAAADGKISYLVLRSCHRFYMHLGPNAPATSRDQHLLPIEGVAREVPVVDTPYLMIEGDNIANVVFDQAYEITLTKSGERKLDQSLAETEPATTEVEPTVTMAG